MRTYDNELVARYIFDPSKEMFGSIKCGSHVNHSSKGYLNVSGRYEQYLGGSTKLRTPYYSTAATYVGDTFSRLYKKLCMDNWRMHPNSETILSYMMDIINAHRLAHLSSAGRLITYIAPWMYFNEELMKRTTIGNQINTFCESYGTLLNEKTIVNAYNTIVDI